MTKDIKVSKVNEVYLKIDADPGIKMEISDYFEFFVPGYKHMPKYKAKMWDGKIRLFSPMTGRLYQGLLKNVIEFAKLNKYSIDISNDLVDFNTSFNFDEFIKSVVLDPEIVPRDYQRDVVEKAVKFNRTLTISPTATGKSLMLYLLGEYHRSHGRKILIIVNRTSLLKQLTSDFYDYRKSTDLAIHALPGSPGKMTPKECIFTFSDNSTLRANGFDKLITNVKNTRRKKKELAENFKIGDLIDGKEVINIDHIDIDYTITTWQSIQKVDKVWFKNYDVILGDEAHNFKANVLCRILEKAEDIKYRYGFTGTLDGSKTNKMVLEGLFGPVHIATNTKEQIEKGNLADLKVNAIILDYPKEVREYAFKTFKDYQKEVDWVISYPQRNEFIYKLASSLKGNTIIVTQYVDKHALELKKLFENKGKTVYYFTGSVDADEREKMRHQIEDETDAVIIVTYGVFQEGINIKNLDHAIFAHSSKSQVRVLQTIGRILRKGSSGKARVWDIVDDLRSSKKQNFLLRHFYNRVEIYHKQGFDISYKEFKIGN